MARTGRQAYTVLLILTDGAISDLNATKNALISASKTPLSVVIIGVGNADFGAMRFLDDFQAPPPARDIAQFVQFNKHAHNKSSLTAATLEEVPDQLVNYFTSRNIQPIPMMSVSHLNVTPDPYDEETDIDLSLDFKGEDEITLNGGGPVIDNASYDSGSKYFGLTAVPPPTAPTAPPSFVSQPQPYSPSSTYSQPVDAVAPQPTFRVQVSRPNTLSLSLVSS